MPIIEAVDAATFETAVLKSDLPVFVDFHTLSCGPCRAILPALEDMASEFAGEVRIVKVDIEAEPVLAEAYGIASVPTFLMFRSGEVRERLAGGMTRGKLALIFERHAGAAR